MMTIHYGSVDGVQRERFHGFIGGCAAMQAAYRAIERMASSRATVFITGESGTGKEVAAEAIHAAGPRAGQPFIALNCGAIPENLLESELFGHVKGAFTGATDHRPGAIREAEGGTLFLDEICEMDPRLQVKLLRFLQTGRVQRVGCARAEPVDVRIVCATNRDPTQEVREGRFREDFFYRLAVIPLDLPPLRARGQDVLLLASAFLDRFAREEGCACPPLGPQARHALLAHDWPGNVRELQNLIRRAVVMRGEGSIALTNLLPRPAAPPGAPERVIPAAPAPARFDGLTLDVIERLAIEQAVERARGSLPAAARALGISPSTLYRKRERWRAVAPEGGELAIAA